MNIETIKQFNELKISKQFNILLTGFSSLISGFIVIFTMSPNYCKETNALIIILLSFSFIAPVYILNQICSAIIISRIIKNGLSKLTQFVKLSGEGQVAADNLTDYLTNHFLTNSIYSSPTRQTGEVVTIISSYFTALMVWIFNISLFPTYLFIIGFSVSTFFILKVFVVAIIKRLTPEHFKPLMSKLRENKDFKSYLSKRLNRMEKIIKEKKNNQELNDEKSS